MTRMLALSLVVLAGGISAAEAAVRGGQFKGTINAVAGNSAIATLDFAAEGDARQEEQNIGGLSDTYLGTYWEFELGPISIWTGTFDELPTYETWGISFFNVITSYHLTNLDQPAADGWLLRVGDAEIDEE